jgi:hypothetical protein
MSLLRLYAFLLLVGVAAAAQAQQAPGHGTEAASDPLRQAPGMSDAGASVQALLAENARLKRQVELLTRKVELLELRLRTLEGSR